LYAVECDDALQQLFGGVFAEVLLV
jgi:hypothetical protein